MRWKRSLWTALAAALLSAGMGWAETAKTKGTPAKGPDVLREGAYSAKVKALVCMGCGPFVEEALGGVPGIESAAVDQKKSEVVFRVKKGSQVPMADIKKALKASQERMGMGADFTLSELRSVKKAG